MPVDDGITFDLASMSVQEIREQAAYPGFRIRVGATIGHWQGTSAWDVSTGDPIVPAPRMVTIERLLDAPLTVLGYAAETVIAEKAITILERGITSTRWRDYVDIIQLCKQGFDPAQFRQSAEAIVRYRGLVLGPVAARLAGYGAVGQAKWAAWRRKSKLEQICEEQLDDQIRLITTLLDPILIHDA